MRFFLRNLNQTSGLLEPNREITDFLGDWVTPHGSELPGTPESVLFNNAYLCHVLALAAEAAGVAGDAPSAANFTAAAASIGAAVHRAFFVPDNSSYIDSRQTHLVMPLMAGSVVPADAVAGVVRALEAEILVAQEGYIDTGLHGTYFMAKLLSDPDFAPGAALAHAMMTKTDGASYGGFLANGYTTWAEAWGGAESKMHGCLNGFGLWFSQSLLGVRSASPGFASFSVRPAYGVGGLAWARGATASPLGAIETAWTALGGSNSTPATNFTASLLVPANTQCELYVPAASADHVTEGGVPAASAAGVRFLRVEAMRTAPRPPAPVAGERKRLLELAVIGGSSVFDLLHGLY
jgi:alpha-L-rhamnosidase